MAADLMGFQKNLARTVVNKIRLRKLVLEVPNLQQHVCVMLTDQTTNTLSEWLTL